MDSRLTDSRLSGATKLNVEKNGEKGWNRVEPSRNRVTRSPENAQWSTRFARFAKQCQKRNRASVPRNRMKSEEGPRRLLVFAGTLPSIKILLLEQGEPNVRFIEF